MGVKRYSPPNVRGQYDVESPGRMHRDDGGGWVRYEDFLTAPTHPTKETYTREQLLGDEAVEAAAKASFDRCMVMSGHPLWDASIISEGERDRRRLEAKADLEAALDAIHKGKGGKDV